MNQNKDEELSLEVKFETKLTDMGYTVQNSGINRHLKTQFKAKLKQESSMSKSLNGLKMIISRKCLILLPEKKQSMQKY